VTALGGGNRTAPEQDELESIADGEFAFGLPTEGQLEDNPNVEQAESLLSGLSPSSDTGDGEEFESKFF
jgi:hypothetical protein